MSNVPIASGPDEVHPHAPHTGHRAVDLVIAVCAIAISLISLFIAIEHGRTEERLVAANSWPFLVFTEQRTGGPRGDVVTLVLQNPGVGPANVKSLLVRYDGQIVSDHQTLLARCCGYRTAGFGPDTAAGFSDNASAIGIVAAREQRVLLGWRQVPEPSIGAGATAGPGPGPAAPNPFEALARADKHLTFEACYCSVLNQCWTTDLKSTTTPREVERCALDARSYHD